MLNQAMDFIFTDTLAFAINATLGAVVRTKLCNYSWEQRIENEPPKEEISDSKKVSVLPSRE
ncbi:MAG: hypothetical protein DSM106950_38165 [Stigonema ocellatum SAG 48.90 = DSM 106950]|nr:hypothetical protein [Stigonema ocellatum SAG 48.90 = DSM 106950]